MIQQLIVIGYVFALAIMLSMVVQTVFGSIAMLPPETIPVTNMSLNNNNNTGDGYHRPSAAEVATFNQAREENKQLMEDLSAALNCNDANLCNLVFAGHGVVKLEFSDGNEDSFRLDFLGLDEARTIVGDIELTPEPEEMVPTEEVEEEEESGSGSGSGSEEDNGSSDNDNGSSEEPAPPPPDEGADAQDDTIPNPLFGGEGTPPEAEPEVQLSLCQLSFGPPPMCSESPEIANSAYHTPILPTPTD